MLKIKKVTEESKDNFIKELQASFRKASGDDLKDGEEIISREEIESSMEAENAESLQFEMNGKVIGGAVVNINKQSNNNALELFYIVATEHGNGLGLASWKEIEKAYPKTKRWETVTPYFEKRNIHFYVNKCGFKIVEFFKHEAKKPEPTENCDEIYEMFRFEKIMS